MVNRIAPQAVVHIRYAGKSWDLPLIELDLAAGFSDVELKRVLAHRLDVAAGELRDYVVDRHATGNVTVRPAAVFG